MTPPKATHATRHGAEGDACVTVPAGHHLMAEAPDAVLNALREALRLEHHDTPVDPKSLRPSPSSTPST